MTTKGFVMQTKPTLGATALAVTASILALSSGGYQVWRGLKLADLAVTYSEEYYPARRYTMSLDFFSLWLDLEAGLSLFAAILVVFGVVCVLVRKSLGRWLVLVGGAIAIGHTIIGCVATARTHHWFVFFGDEAAGWRWFNTPNVPVMILLSFVVPVIAAGLLWLPAARSWWGGSRGWSVSLLKQASKAFLAEIRAGLRPSASTAYFDPTTSRPANLTNPFR
ncbi:hypothetical protein BST27_11425 [Mycobacterium intermedium]|uniref:Uncharacterized protein n=1 Tax=Mycobacterium intermedium TaxID=28445 RepID=A0A1E3SD92_MYCIE|nr:hypothetical protein [Mycobacterium intermedium]MCV6963181.1 hypothetical protein [Mycobacterium intermedium]ODQ99537.1 hypothetical protein BHQ20_16925 [Mycobacterium intermedium]OPE51701.1 hypothetical protein BV508_05450 [Mycobacterium intermedium]ORB06103.1 hypothetical protein BST27_11425 [Mycobacterium intermedium]